MTQVFVSHKDSDGHLAERVATRLKMNGVQCYLDIIDHALVKDGSELVDYLLERMGRCDQLIAVLSKETSESWWVPWEIGVGCEKGFRLASFSQQGVFLPSYLERWPALHSMEDVDMYCSFSSKSEESIRRAKARAIGPSGEMAAQKREAAEFHKELLRALARTR